MKPVKCSHHGCKNKHKSPTGYCSEHAEDSVKHVVKAREIVIPHLAEEDEDDYETNARRYDKRY